MVLRRLITRALNANQALTLFFVYTTLLTLVTVWSHQAEAIGIAAEAPAVSLRRGRELLDQGRLKDADLHYRLIPWMSELWPEKVEDHIRYFLTQPRAEFADNLAPTQSDSRRAEEAWRLAQLLHRVRRFDSPTLHYEEALAAYIGGSCPLLYSPAGDVLSELLWASVYRYAADFKEAKLHFNESFDEFYEGARTDSFSAGLVPYLSEIKNVKLVRGAGCRSFRWLLDPKRAPQMELDHLLNAIRSTHVKDHDPLVEQTSDHKVEQTSDHKVEHAADRKVEPGYELKGAELWTVELHALLLAHKLGNRAAEKQLKVQLQQQSNDEMIRLAPAERRIAWSEKFDVSEGTRYRKGEIEAALVVSILNDAPLDDVDWFALVDLDSYSPRERKAILLPWRERDVEHAHPYLSLKLAEAEYQLGEVEAALQDLRDGSTAAHQDAQEVSIGVATQVDHPAGEPVASDEFVADLAERIFREYHFNTKVLGALRGTLSPRLWHSIEDRLLYDYVVSGDAASFGKILEGFHSNDEQLRPVMKAFAQRHFAPYATLWKALARKNAYLSPAELSFARSVAHALFTLTLNQRLALLPYTKIIAETLQIKMTTANPELVEEQQLLMHQLAGPADESLAGSRNSKPSAAWEEGNALVRSGVISAGRVALSSSPKIENPFHFSVPAVLPKARLVLLPDGSERNRWILK